MMVMTDDDDSTDNKNHSRDKYVMYKNNLYGKIKR